MQHPTRQTIIPLRPSYHSPQTHVIDFITDLNDCLKFSFLTSLHYSSGRYNSIHFITTKRRSQTAQASSYFVGELSAYHSTPFSWNPMATIACWTSMFRYLPPTGSRMMFLLPSGVYFRVSYGRLSPVIHTLEVDESH